MLRYENKGFLIEIKLPGKHGYNGYSVECRYTYIRENDHYLLSVWLHRDDIDDKFKIDGQKIDTQPVSGTKETIKQNICQIVEQMSSSGFFDCYVDRYEYTYKCFDKGNDFFERDCLHDNYAV